MHRITLAQAARAVVPLVLMAAATGAAAGPVMDRIKLRDQITIGYREDSQPFSFTDPATKQPVGYSIELCKGIAERIVAELGKKSLRIQFVPVPADQVVRVVSTGGVDLHCAGTSDTEERRASMAFSTPIFVTYAKFLVRVKDNIKSVEQLRGQDVVVLGRTTAEAAVPAFSQQRGLDITLSRAITADAALGQLQIGQAKAYMRDEILLLSQLAKHPKPGDFAFLPDVVSVELNAIALPKGDPELQRAVDQGLALQVRSGKAAKLYREWFILPHAGAPKGLQLAMPKELKAEFDRLR